MFQKYTIKNLKTCYIQGKCNLMIFIISEWLHKHKPHVLSICKLDIINKRLHLKLQPLSMNCYRNSEEQLGKIYWT